MDAMMTSLFERLVDGASGMLPASKRPSGRRTHHDAHTSLDEALSRHYASMGFLVAFYCISSATMVLMTLGRSAVPVLLFHVFAGVWWCGLLISKADEYLLLGIVERIKAKEQECKELGTDGPPAHDQSIHEVYSSLEWKRAHSIEHQCERAGIFTRITTCIYILGTVGAILSLFIRGRVWEATSVTCSALMIVPALAAATWRSAGPQR